MGKKFKLKKLIQFPRDIYNYNMYFLKTIFVIYPKKKKFYLHIALSHYFASMFILNIIFLKYSNNIYIYTHITYLFIFIHVLSNVQYIFWPYYTQLKIYYYFIHSYNYYKIQSKTLQENNSLLMNYFVGKTIKIFGQTYKQIKRWVNNSWG